MYKIIDRFLKYNLLDFGGAFNIMKILFKKNLFIWSILVFISILLLLIINNKVFYIDNKFNIIIFSISIIADLLLSFLICTDIEYSDKKKKITSIIVAFCGILLYISIELLNKSAIFFIYPKRLLFNFLVIFIINLLLFCIINKIKLSIIISSFLLFLLALSSHVIESFRGFPLLPWDILSFKTATTIMTSYTFNFTYNLILAILVFISAIILALKIKYVVKKSKNNLIFRFVSIVSIILFLLIFYKTNFINFFDFQTSLWKPYDEYKNNGFVASFLKQTKNLIRTTPDDYNTSDLQKDMNQYIDIVNKKDENLNLTSETNNNNEEKPNIIVIMNESFADMNTTWNIKTSEDPLKFFRSLKENTIKGSVSTSVFGSQTPNSEWEFLTNNSMAFMPYKTVPYQQYIYKSSPSLVSTLESQGYKTSGIHPWYGAGYRRNIVYSLFGFDEFYALEQLQNLEYIRNYPSDLSTYKDLIKLFEEKKSDEKIFNFTITMQNHSGYDFVGYEPTVYAEDGNFPRVDQYLSLIKESDKAFEYLINYFKNYNEKTIILMFGDHQPPYLEDEFWDMIGKNYDFDNLEDLSKKYITPFVLWTNYNISEKEINNVSLNYLPLLLLDTAGLKTTPYMEFLRQLQEQIPVITSNGYMDENSKYYKTDDTSSPYYDIINRYKLIQYNNVFDVKHRINNFFYINSNSSDNSSSSKE